MHILADTVGRPSRARRRVGGYLLPRDYGLHVNVEGDPRDTNDVGQCVESYVAKRIVLAHNVGGSMTHPAVTNVEGPVSDDS